MHVLVFDVFVLVACLLAFLFMVVSGKRRLTRIDREWKLRVECDRKHPAWKLIQAMPTDFGDHEEIIPDDSDPAEVVRSTSMWRRIGHFLFWRYYPLD